MERPTWQITDGGLQSTVSEELRPTALEELKPGNTCVGRARELKLVMGLQPVRDPESGAQLSHSWIPDPQILWDHKCVLFKPQSSG